MSGQTAPELGAGNGKHLHCETKKNKKKERQKAEFNPSHFLLRLPFVLRADQQQETERWEAERKYNPG